MIQQRINRAVFFFFFFFASSYDNNRHLVIVDCGLPKSCINIEICWYMLVGKTGKHQKAYYFSLSYAIFTNMFCGTPSSQQ